jgi:hypothetical protein
VWVSGPAGEGWEDYTVLADSETFGTSPQRPGKDGEQMCCGTAEAQAKADGERVGAGGPCC